MSSGAKNQILLQPVGCRTVNQGFDSDGRGVNGLLESEDWIISKWIQWLQQERERRQVTWLINCFFHDD